MPRYFFHVFDGRAEFDTDGTELPDWQAARVEAIRLAGRIIDDEAHRLALSEDWYMEVTTEEGLILFRLDFHITAAPAVRDDQSGKGRSDRTPSS